MELSFHYVVFGYERDYFRVMFQEAVEKLGVEYIDNPIRHSIHNRTLSCLYDIHHNQYLNWRFDLPLKKKWYSLYYKGQQSKPICFVFLMEWNYPKYIPLYKLLRKNYPGCKLVLYLEDIVTSRGDVFSFETLSYFDRVVSYDKGDAEHYGFLCYQTFMSKIDLPKQKEKQTDVCFWGVEKNRKEMINAVYQHLNNGGLKCDFLVTGVRGKNTLTDGIKTRKHDKPYMDYIQAVTNSNCILEIMHHTAVGYTLRTWEAMLYSKVLLTNNEELRNSPYYNPEKMMLFNHVEEINIDKLRGLINNNSAFDYPSVSPVSFFYFLEDNLL